jgi:hypothetical protein
MTPPHAIRVSGPGKSLARPPELMNVTAELPSHESQRSRRRGTRAADGPPRPLASRTRHVQMLKQLIGAKHELLDPTVAVYLEDILTVRDSSLSRSLLLSVNRFEPWQDALEDVSKRVILFEALNDFVPDWDQQQEVTDMILDKLIEIPPSNCVDDDPAQRSPLQMSDEPTAVVAANSIRKDSPAHEQGKCSGPYHRNERCSQQKSIVRKESVAESDTSDSQPPDILGENMRAIIQQLTYSAESFDDVLLEYLERATVEFLEDCDAGHKEFQSPDDRAELLDLFVGCVPNLTVDTERLDDFLKAALCIHLR